MIRQAIASDKAAVVRMSKAFHTAAQLPFAFSAATTSMLFDACLHDEDRLCLIDERDGAPVGMLAAYAACHMLAPVKVANEIAWWVEPQHRGRSAVAMLRAYEQWAQQRGCVLIHMVGLGADPVTTKLYERQGYLAAERHFMKPLSA
jgi:GNAT superfamily N-acetyltransferase